jgi:hypothetical protein
MASLSGFESRRLSDEAIELAFKVMLWRGDLLQMDDVNVYKHIAVSSPRYQSGSCGRSKMLSLSLSARFLSRSERRRPVGSTPSYAGNSQPMICGGKRSR